MFVSLFVYLCVCSSVVVWRERFCKELILKLENEVMTSTSNYGNQPLRGVPKGSHFLGVPLTSATLFAKPALGSV